MDLRPNFNIPVDAFQNAVGGYGKGIDALSQGYDQGMASAEALRKRRAQLMLAEKLKTGAGIDDPEVLSLAMAADPEMGTKLAMESASKVQIFHDPLTGEISTEPKPGYLPGKKIKADEAYRYQASTFEKRQADKRAEAALAETMAQHEFNRNLLALAEKQRAEDRARSLEEAKRNHDMMAGLADDRIDSQYDAMAVRHPVQNFFGMLPERQNRNVGLKVGKNPYAKYER